MVNAPESYIYQSLQYKKYVISASDMHVKLYLCNWICIDTTQYISIAYINTISASETRCCKNNLTLRKEPMTTDAF